MIRCLHLIALCLVVMSAGLGCAPKLVGPTNPSGYFFALQASDAQLWLGSRPDSRIDPSSATLTVRVQNAQGQPVDGVPVTFHVDGKGDQNTWLMPPQATTEHGNALTLFQPKAVGVYRVRAQVEQYSQETEIYVNSRNLCCDCQVWPAGYYTCGRGP
jgi:hypothetical protein